MVCHEEVTRPQPRSFNASRGCGLSERISPPPTKRQRVASVPTSFRDGLSSTGIGLHPPKVPSLARSRSGGPGGLYVHSVHDQARYKQAQDRTHSSSLLVPSIVGDLEDRIVNSRSRHSDGIQSGISLTDSSSKRACRVCEKTSTTNYNPIFDCPGCERPYHDSCRKPPLIEGSSPQHWKCSRCLNSDQIRKPGLFITPYTARTSLGLSSVLANKGGIVHGKYTKQRKSLPETSYAASSPEENAKSSPLIADAAEAGCSSTPITNHISSSFRFQSNLVKPGLITQTKVRDAEAPCAPTEPHKALTSFECPADVLNIANINGQVFVCKATELIKLSSETRALVVLNRNDNHKPALSTSQAQSTPIQKDSESGPLARDKAETVKEMTRRNILDKFMANDDPATAVSWPQQPDSAATGPSPSTATESSLSRKTSVDTLSENSTTCYTNRELARIALVAANFTQLSAFDIIDWLANRFTHLRKGEGAWEESINTILSSFPEFHGDTIAGEQGPTKLYSIASPTMRERYQREYHEYCTTSNPVNTSLARETRHKQSCIAKTVEHAPAPELAAPTRRSCEPRVVIYKKQLQSKRSNSGDALFTPFVRLSPRQLGSPLKLDHGVTRETRFYSVVRQGNKLSVETMTEIEKAKKIAEIKARPPRKRYFGPDYRLAHVRRYNRQDIHDESDGAWKPHCFSDSEKESQLDKDFKLEDNKTARSLKDVFGLPDNAIPMNDGQTELAFRDGTLTNGRLPRSRHVYKVGKLFGGELTIRTS
ncbi:hypothetical protein BKA66DRAFT_575253 [Pyrenochaeta sp. MPI-SDFR-AT-0127]|nr:hypothetical protein BKA66DRAFT_575253 [Pyrenochaeta sp. MPI-SDFR-AT-0127]